MIRWQFPLAYCMVMAIGGDSLTAQDQPTNNNEDATHHAAIESDAAAANDSHPMQDEISGDQGDSNQDRDADLEITCSEAMVLLLVDLITAADIKPDHNVVDAWADMMRWKRLPDDITKTQLNAEVSYGGEYRGYRMLVGRQGDNSIFGVASDDHFDRDEAIQELRSFMTLEELFDSTELGQRSTVYRASTAHRCIGVIFITAGVHRQMAGFGSIGFIDRTRAEQEFGKSICEPSNPLKTVLEAVRLLANDVVAESQIAMGGAYYYGNNGLNQDYVEAVKWFRVAAERGSPRGQILLGTMYLNGEGVPQDSEEFVKWYRLAAEQGHAGAQDQMGLVYSRGEEGMPHDDSQAVEWFRLAADQGWPGAQHNLGVMYQSGRGVPQSSAEALKWYRLAAEQGHASAQNNLGNMYNAGESVPQDRIEGLKWHRLAAEQGHGDAMYNMAVVYINGQSVPRDYVRAYAWANIARADTDNGVRADANKVISYLASRMTAQQIAEAKKMSLEISDRITASKTDTAE